MSKPIHRSDYAPYSHNLLSVCLHFELSLDHVIVTSEYEFTAIESGVHSIRLDGDSSVLSLDSAVLDGQILEPNRLDCQSDALVISNLPQHFKLKLVQSLNPSQNTSFFGLYVSDDNLCTQCESQGFRNICYFPDRPDVLSIYTVTLEASRAQFPYLLSNGHVIETIDLGDKHRVIWHDPYPKPSYLFALCAGRYDVVTDRFETQEKRQVKLSVFVKPGYAKRAEFALQALKRSMHWDEQVFSRFYDGPVFNIVAVSDFNFGAMENKSLNIFLDRLILLDKDLATDQDTMISEAVIAHEYFHNWSGNRVTCRDWFQLSLKEGLTVYRDQCYQEDQFSTTCRLDEIAYLTSVQFREDSSPLAHPVRPDSFVSIENFYTPTVYHKGAEVIRMIALILGQQKFMQAVSDYFSRFDGQSITIDDWLTVMQAYAPVDLNQFSLWYSQSGTPQLKINSQFDEQKQQLIINCQQSTPPTLDQPTKQALLIPIRFCLFDGKGNKLILDQSQVHSKLLFESTPGDYCWLVDSLDQSLVLHAINTAPVLSLLRGLSAPCHLNQALPLADQAHLIRYESDDYVRWHTLQVVFIDAIESIITNQFGSNYDSIKPIQVLLDCFNYFLTDDEGRLGHGHWQHFLVPPKLSVLFERSVHTLQTLAEARSVLMKIIATQFQIIWFAEIKAAMPVASYQFTPSATQQRIGLSVALSYAMIADEVKAAPLVLEFYHQADNLTDRLAALKACWTTKSEIKTSLLAKFYQTYGHEDLLYAKWLTCQALDSYPGVLKYLISLSNQPRFNSNNNAFILALWGQFAKENLLYFYTADAVKFYMELILTLDARNPSTACRLLDSFSQYKRLEPAKQSIVFAKLNWLMSQKVSSRLNEQLEKLVSI